MITCISMGIFMAFGIILIRGPPMWMAFARLRHRTILIVDEDTKYEMPAVEKDGPAVITTKDGRSYGKVFRIKTLSGIRVGFAIRDEFIMPEAAISAGIEHDNELIDEPDNYIKCESSGTKVKYDGKLVKLSELTKGLTNKTSPLLIKAAMVAAADEAVRAREGEPARWGMMILMACIGIGVMATLLKKAGLW